MARILVIEDSRDIADLIAHYLTGAGYETTMTANGSEGLRLARATPPDAIILDLMLPGLDGLHVCQALRAENKTAAIPIIMLTARGEESDRIRGLEFGADDYVTKPFSPKELVARVGALLRRVHRPVAPGKILTYGPLTIDVDKHVVQMDGETIRLTAKEFLLLQYLIEHRGRVLSRDQLLTDVWSYQYTGGTRTVDVHIRRLREKVPYLGTAITTVKQFGYKLEDPGTFIVTFRTRTFLAILIACAMALAASTALVTTSLRRNMLADIENSLLRQVRLAAELLSDRGTLADADAEAAVMSRLIDSRVTFIRADGVVIGDSDVDTAALDSVDNHLMREEVQEALKTGTGAAVRQSRTTGEETMYAAATVRNGPVAFVRLGLPLTSVREHLADARRLAWGGLGVGLVAALLITWATSTWLSRRVRAIAQLSARYRAGDFTRPTTDFGRDEIGTVARVLDETARQLGGRLAEVARERAHMDAVLQGMVEGAVLVNRQGKLVITNPAVRMMLRLPDNAEGRHFLEVVRHPEVAAQLTAALTGTRPAPAEVQLDSQSRRSFVARAVPVDADRDGGAVLVLHDVTELRQADMVRRDFVANVSHELRTPLTAIRGYVEALMDAPGDPALADKFLAIIARHAERMDRLVTDLLRLARLDARQETLQPVSTPVASLLTNVVSEMDTAVQARRLRVHTSIAPDAQDAFGDPAKLHDVLRNLLENAINYSPEDGEITITAARDDGVVEIAVSDRGPGIPEADLSRIFERFYRVDRSRTRDPGGTGLGLSIVKHLVELHGGRVSARNREGGGASVVVRLPDAPAGAPV